MWVGLPVALGRDTTFAPHQKGNQMNYLGLTLSSIALLGTACAVDQEEPNYDEAQLELSRQALPTRGQLEAPRATPSTATLLGAPAEYPRASAEVIQGINGAVGATVDMLEFVTSLPPTVYNSDTLEFVWGPFPADDYGYMAAYIKDTGDAGDFRFEYALLRGASNDLATLTPIIYGGATPDPVNEDRGQGVTVWDMTAADAFAAEHDPNYDASAAHDTGRFAAAFAAGASEDDPDTEVALVVAVFRDFIPADSEDGLPVDLDYFYGHGDAPEASWDFVDFEAGVDVSEPLDGLQENLGVRMAFLDGGIGRAEADAIGGSLEPGQSYDVVECWDTSLNQTFVEANVKQDGVSTLTESLGTPEDCGLFNASLDDMGVPRLENVDAELMAALDEVATNGI
jgi:hypothetical protein